jgi:protein-tyrosine-phosphatase
MVIHFICRGNTHRSRLAEAYAGAATAHCVDVAVMSSGIQADRDLNGPVVPFVKRTLENDNLLQFTGETWTQTTQALIDRSDVLVFMSDDVYEDAAERFRIPVQNSQRWQIADVEGVHEQIEAAVHELLRHLEVVDAS